MTAALTRLAAYRSEAGGGRVAVDCAHGRQGRGIGEGVNKGRNDHQVELAHVELRDMATSLDLKKIYKISENVLAWSLIKM